MAYNLQSLVQILEQLLHSDGQLWILDHNKNQLESLLKKVISLKENFENSSPASWKRTEVLGSQIIDAANEAEDIIESYIMDHVLENPRVKNFIIFLLFLWRNSGFIISPLDYYKSWRWFFFKEKLVSLPDIQHLIEKIDSIRDHVLKSMDQTPDSSFSQDSSSNNFSSQSSFHGVSIRPDPSSQKFVVGLDEDLIQLKDRLTGRGTELTVIPIVGMGGIGKTTLSWNLYNDPLIISRFDNYAWVTISQEYNLRAILLGILGCIKVTNEMLAKENDELAVILHQELVSRRYLIILDDVWSINVWDDIQRFFPDNNNRSRIMLTTRELDVANFANPSGSHHQMHLLNKDESWNLLCEKVFGKESSTPPELENIGKNIARNCGGLPLAIEVIGGLLSEAKKTKDFWEHVANDVTSAAAEKDKKFPKILSLSYDHLPHHLRPCLLYIGAFPEDYVVRSSKLIRLWVAEGFLKPIADLTLEEVAEKYLEALVDKNLISVREIKPNGKVKSYSMHDLVRDLCIEKSRQDKFIYVENGKVHNVLDVPSFSLRRLIVNSSHRITNLDDIMEAISLATRSFMYIAHRRPLVPSDVFPASRLLIVLDILQIQFCEFPEEIFELVNIRYLAVTCELLSRYKNWKRLWNLQTFIFAAAHRRMHFWLSSLLDLTQIRHLKVKFNEIRLDDDYSLLMRVLEDYMSNSVLENLQTLTDVNVEVFTRTNFIKRIPNIRKLGLRIHGSYLGAVDLSCLHKLENLKCSTSGSIGILSADLHASGSFLSSVTFPPSLKSLTLSKCLITRGLLTSVGLLPNLQVFKILYCEFEGQQEWEPIEGEFLSLQYLQLQGLKLEHWHADETHFPRLRHLVIRHCSKMEGIPCGVGDIPTMEVIEVVDSSPAVVASTREIQEEQRELGNYGLQVRIRGAQFQFLGPSSSIGRWHFRDTKEVLPNIYVIKGT